MLATLLLVALSLPQAEVNSFAARVAQSLPPRPGARAVLSVEDPGGVGATEQLARALLEALRQRGFEPATEGDSAAQARVSAYLSLRRGRPLAVARVLSEGREVAVLFAEFAPGAPEAMQPGGPAVAIRTRTLLTLEMPVLDVEADSAGNLFVLHPDRIRVFDLLLAGVPLKAEVGLDTGAERLRDPLVRLLARDSPRQLEVYSAAAAVPAAPPLPLEGYALKTFAAATTMRLPHSARAVFAGVQVVAGRNYFRAAAAPEIQGLAPVSSPLRAHWVLLDGAGRLRLADTDLRTITMVPGDFGGDVASAALSCAGTLVLAAGAEPDPVRDHIAVLRVENDRLLPYTSLELEGAARRLKSLPGTATDQRRVLAVVQSSAGARIEEIELRCAP